MDYRKIFFEFGINDNLIVKGDVYHPINLSVKIPLVVISHGFKGFRNWGFIPNIAKCLAEHHAIAINIDFSMNGIIDEAKQFYDFELFANNTISQEVNDLKELISKFQKRELAVSEDIYNAWNGEIHLIGHSLGGAVSVIASQDIDNVNSLILLASIATVNRSTDRQKKLWKEKGFIELSAVSSGQTLRQNYVYQQDKDNNFERFNIEKILNNFKGNLLVIHGRQDITTPLKEGQSLYDYSTKSVNRSIKVIEKCNHVFNVFHPMKQISKQLEEAQDNILEFLNLNAK
jgi:pimeloyl-ACP methyl ester carboxylesterase